jgi:hypothetical protein
MVHQRWTAGNIFATHFAFAKTSGVRNAGTATLHGSDFNGNHCKSDGEDYRQQQSIHCAVHWILGSHDIGRIRVTRHRVAIVGIAFGRRSL